MHRSEGSRDTLPVSLLIAAVLLFWARLLFLGQIPVIRDPGHLYEDYLSYIPALQFIREALFRGEFPLWSPCSQAGMVLFADPQYTVAYPVTLLLSLLPAPFNFASIVIGHLLLGAVSLYGLCRTLRLSRAGATVASFIYAFSFPAIFGFLLINAVWPWHWLPLILLFVARYAEEGGRRWLLPLSLVWGLQMFTYIQSTYVMMFLAAPFALCLLRPRRGNGGVAACAVRILGLAAALVLGTLAASALLLPLRELSGQVSYKPFTFEEAAIFPLPKEIALESLLSGRPWDSFFAANWSSTFYMGAGGIPLALYSLVAAPRRRLALLLAAVCALALLLALGDRTPLFYLFHRWMPGATRFHAPVRFLWLLPLPISLMAGMGLDGLGARKGRRGRECFFFAALFLCAALLWLGREAAVRPFALVPLSLSGLRLLVVASLAAAAIAVGRALGFVGKGLTAALLAGLSVTEACGCFSYISFVDFKEKYAVPATARFLRERAGLARFFSYNGARRNYATAFPDDDAVSMLYPELSNYFGLYDIQARGPLRVERYDGLIKAMNRRHEMFRERGSYQAEVRNFLSPVVDLFGVRFIVSKGALRVPCEVIYQDPHEIHLRAGESATLPAGRTVSAGAIVLESFLEGAAGAAQGEAVAEIVLQAGGREVAVVPVRAGVHTAEVFRALSAGRKTPVAHSRPAAQDRWVERDWDGNAVEGARFRGVLNLHGAPRFDAVTVRYLCADGLLAVTGVLFLPGDRGEIEERIRRRFTPVFRDPAHGIIIYENRDALPRAFLAESAIVAEGPQHALDLLLGGAVDLSRTVILEEDPPTSALGRTGPGSGAGEVEITDYSPARVELSVRALGDRILFLSDMHYPGWEATVDGKAAKLYRADYAFRAVFVPAGEHRVVIRFRPRSVAVGAGISISLGFLLSAGVVAGFRRGAGRRRSPGQRLPGSTTIKPSSLM